jgi:hypothetical protein
LARITALLGAALALACSAGQHSKLVGMFDGKRYTSARHWFSLEAPLRNPDVSSWDASYEPAPNDWALDALRFGTPRLYLQEVGVVAIPPHAAKVMEGESPETTLSELARLEADSWNYPPDARVEADQPWSSPFGPALLRVYHVPAPPQAAHTLDSWIGVTVCRVGSQFYVFAVVNDDMDVLLHKPDDQLISSLGRQAREALSKLELGAEVTGSR